MLRFPHLWKFTFLQARVNNARILILATIRSEGKIFGHSLWPFVALPSTSLKHPVAPVAFWVVLTSWPKFYCSEEKCTTTVVIFQQT